MKFHESHSPLKREEIVSVETRLNRTWPPELWDFYMKHNGGRPEKRLFKSNGVGFLVHDFVPMKVDSGALQSDFVTVNSLWFKMAPEVISGSSFVIAHDELANALVYVCGEDRGGVFCTADYDTGSQELHLLAPSLALFMEGLTEVP